MINDDNNPLINFSFNRTKKSKIHSNIKEVSLLGSEIEESIKLLGELNNYKSEYNARKNFLNKFK